ncbi:MAG: SDR family oxidoreductase [Alcanivoracaceae bacterium]|jgi:NAD(P)-dependent dehydrogenase (short-subunit alcohol dehydrogenase family)|nr:SDR family oxidoreductase [Alcanivoracaceae bacterium]
MSQRVLITGGASGLGKELAKQYLKSGARVLITDINEQRGNEAEFELRPLGEVHFVKASTTVDADWNDLLEWATNKWGGLDVLVNNAGVAAGGRIDKISMEDWDWIIDINLKGVIRGCRTFVPLFKKQKSGHIVNIASLAAVANAPTMSSYNVTKAGVVSLSETLRHELTPYGIHTTVVCPSFFQTNLAESMRTPEAGMDQTVRKLLSGGKLSAEQVAAKIVRAQQKQRFLELPHTEGKALALIKRYVPALYNYGLADSGRRFYKKLEK